MPTPTLFEIQCALMSGVADHASRNNQQINMYPVPSGWIRDPDSYKKESSGFEATYFAKTNAERIYKRSYLNKNIIHEFRHI